MTDLTQWALRSPPECCSRRLQISRKAGRLASGPIATTVAIGRDPAPRHGRMIAGRRRRALYAMAKAQAPSLLPAELSSVSPDFGKLLECRVVDPVLILTEPCVDALDVLGVTLNNAVEEQFQVASLSIYGFG